MQQTALRLCIDRLNYSVHIKQADVAVEGMLAESVTDHFVV
jgi:hypothetical protein